MVILVCIAVLSLIGLVVCRWYGRDFWAGDGWTYGAIFCGGCFGLSVALLATLPRW